MRTLSRREILTALAAIGSAPAIAWAEWRPAQERLPFAKFRKTADYPKFVAAVRAMKASGDSANPNSWQFWANVHQTHCPHGKDYFLAWHRGYLSLFEAKLREIARSSTLRLPYWDYFADPRLPAELLAGNAATNPLFEIRKGAEVGKALGYKAFASDVTGFQYGQKNCFEQNVEQFHNNVHNLIGGRMATMQSPQDIIFWMHHANIDRLWAAWAKAGQGRQMPAAGQPYWSGKLDYAPDLAVVRAQAIATESFGYGYADLTMPALMSPPRGGAVQPPVTVTPVPPPPPATLEPPMVGAAPGAVPFRGIWLGRESRSVRLPLREAKPETMEGHAGHGMNGDEWSVVLDTLTLTQIGQSGGYFYKLYLDLDDLDYDEIPGENRLIGTVGPFQVAAALNHAADGKARIVIPAGEVVRKLAQGRDPDDLGVTFVRVDAGAAPGGSVIGIERVAFFGRFG
jgi:tyrosinase